MPANAETIEAFLTGPKLLRTSIDGLTDFQLRSKPIADQWSIHEVVCHLADFEIINAERIKRIIAEDNPTIFNAEPDPFMANLCYAGRNTESELQLIELIRTHVGSILRIIESSQWERSGQHSTDGPLTAKQIVERVTSHIPHHLTFIEAKRRAMRA